MSVEEVVNGQRAVRTATPSDVTVKNEKLAYAVVDGQECLVVTNVGGGSGTTLTAVQATLDADDWSSNEQTVSVQGITLSNIVFVSPAPSSYSDYSTAGIYCSSQGTDELVFKCSDVPSVDIVVNIVHS